MERYMYVEIHFEQNRYDNYCTGKEYQMKEAHTFQKFSIKTSFCVQLYVLLIVVYFLIFYKHMTTMCIVQLFRNPCNMKATDCNFFDRYVYPSGSSGAIDTDMAPKCFYEYQL